MISNEFFTREIAKLMDQFGASKFSKRKNELIYQVIKDLDAREFVSIIDGFIGNSKFAPNVDDFRDKSRQYLINKAKTSKVECSTCRGIGAVVVRKKTGEVGEYAFRCTCANGAEYSGLQLWRDSFASKFTRQVVPYELTQEFYAKQRGAK